MISSDIRVSFLIFLIYMLAVRCTGSKNSFAGGNGLPFEPSAGVLNDESTQTGGPRSDLESNQRHCSFVIPCIHISDLNDYYCLSQNLNLIDNTDHVVQIIKPVVLQK